MTGEEKSEDLRKFCITLYGAYAVSIVLGFFEDTLVLSLFLMIVAWIMGGFKKKKAVGTPYASHLLWMNRSLWIGSGVYAPIALVVSGFLISTFTDSAPILQAMDSGDPDVVMASLQGYLTQNTTKMLLLTLVTTLPVGLWWLRRCWLGYKLVKEDKPVENVKSWL